MKLRFFIASFTLLLFYTVEAQDQQVINSLNQAYEIAKHDTDKINCLFTLGEALIGPSPDTVLIIEILIQQLAERGLASNPPPDLEEKLLASLSEAFSNIGYIYYNLGNVQKALEYDHKSLKIYEELGNKRGTAGSLNNIAFIYKRQGDIDKALESYQKSLKIYSEIGYKRGIALSLSNIGGLYDEQGDVDKAIELYYESLKIHEDIGNKRGISHTLNNIGLFFENQGDVPKALEYYRKSLKVDEEINNNEGIANSISNIGTLELGLGNINQAMESGNRGLSISQDIGSPRSISVNAHLLSKINKHLGKYEEALEMYELYIQMRDSIKNEATQKATIRQQTKYEFEKAQLVKEQEEKEAARVVAEETSRRDNMQYSVILIALLILGVGVMALGRVSVSPRVAEGLIFFSFLILFEFLLVLADPTIERWSGGAPGIKLLFNAGIAALIFPLHSLFERKLKERLVN